MKPFFRFLTAEISGFYITSLHHFLNPFTDTLKNTLTYMTFVQFKLESEDILANEIPIEEADVLGIGYIAGVFSPLISAEHNLGSLVFTNKETHGDFTERGLFNFDSETFEIIRKEQEIYSTDIVTEANERRRASFVSTSDGDLFPAEDLDPEDQLYPEGGLEGEPEIQGWILHGVDVLDIEGNLIPENIIPPDEEPTSGYYYPFFGEKYLYLAEIFLKFSPLDIEVYKPFVECMQRIRRNGASLQELLFATTLLTEDYVKIVEISSSGVVQMLHYTLNEGSALYEKVKRLSIWLKFLDMKFKQVIPQEVV